MARLLQLRFVMVAGLRSFSASNIGDHRRYAAFTMPCILTVGSAPLRAHQPSVAVRSQCELRVAGHALTRTNLI